MANILTEVILTAKEELDQALNKANNVIPQIITDVNKSLDDIDKKLEETKELIDGAGAASKQEVEEVKSSLEEKVNKEVGKGLSTNDYDDIAQTEVSKIKNKAEYTYVDNKVATLSSATPKFVNSIDEMTDITKNYVLMNDSEGYIYTHNGTSFIQSSVKYQSQGVGNGVLTHENDKYKDDFLLYCNGFLYSTKSNNDVILTSNVINVWWKYIDNSSWGSFTLPASITIPHDFMLIGNMSNSTIEVVSTSKNITDKKIKILLINSYGFLFGALSEFVNINNTSKQISKNIEDIANINDTIKNKKIPSYYNSEIERARNKVANDITNAKCSVFAFITDQQSSFNEDKTHNMLENYTNINYLADYIPFNFIANGGDFINGNTPKANTMEELKQYAKLTFETSVVPYGIVRGNHDDNSYYSMNNGSLYDDLITPLDWYKNVIKYIERYPQFVFDNDNREGGYYYYDDENAKIRYIWINTYDTPAIRNNDGTYKYDLMHTPAISNKQMQWLAHKALNFSSKEVPSDWAVIAFSHYVHGTTKNYSLLLNLLNAYEKGIAYTGSTDDEDFACSINVDFASQGKGEFITFICGDTHEDRGFSNLFFDINLITRRSSLADNYDAPRPIKTDQQDAFDIVVVDRETKQIRTTRFGSGEDAVFNYETYTPKYIP